MQASESQKKASAYSLLRALLSRDESLNLRSWRASWPERVEKTRLTRVASEAPNFSMSLRYSARMSRLTLSTSPKSLSARYAPTAWGMPPTSMYSLNSLSALRWSASGGLRASYDARVTAASPSSPDAQRNSSKSSGLSLIARSSDGMTMSLTFSLIDMSEPVSM